MGEQTLDLVRRNRADWNVVAVTANSNVAALADAAREFAAEVARSVSGSCDDAPLVMGGEDFAYMLQERPGAYILGGNGDTTLVHHPEYNFNDEAIPAGCSWWAEIVERRMPVA